MRIRFFSDLEVVREFLANNSSTSSLSAATAAAASTGNAGGVVGPSGEGNSDPGSGIITSMFVWMRVRFSLSLFDWSL